MNKITDKEILEAAMIGYELEFISNEEPIKIARELSKVLGVKVVVPMNVDEFNKQKLFYHSTANVSGSQFKLEADFSGGINCKELITGPLHYNEAKEQLVKILNWLKLNASTTDRTAIQINVSFDQYMIKCKNICELDPLKFCLSFNEDFVWKRFPNRKNSIYCKSIKNILINNIFNISNYTASNFTIAPDRYYSVNLTKIPNNYLEFRFMGGENYHTKKKEILEIQDYSILNLYRILNMSELTSVDKEKLDKIYKENEPLLLVYNDPDFLRKCLPDVELTVDMNNDPVVIKAMWGHIKDGFMNRVSRAGTRNMKINYDSEGGEWQIKDAKLKMAELSNTTFVNCSGYGILTDCSFFKCKMEMVHSIEGTIDGESTFKNSKIEETSAEKGTVLENCYINNKNKICDCEVVGGVWRNGRYGQHTKLSNDCSVVSYKEATIPKPPKNYGRYEMPDEHQFTNLTLDKLIFNQ